MLPGSSEAPFNYEVFGMDADGTDQVNLTNNLALDVNHTWSPDGTKIAFEGGFGDVHLMSAAGGTPTNTSVRKGWRL